MANESFLREDLASKGVPGEALAMLEWAKAVADAAPPGDIFRSREGRRTLRFTAGEASFFLKLHQGIGWSEVVKNLLQLRLPVLGASNEYRAVKALQAIGVDTMQVAAYALKGKNPAQLESLIVTDDLVGTVSLEDYCADWAERPPPWRDKLRLLLKVADSARRMHGAGINHRDFYICHFHLAPESLSQKAPRCHIIDLHRAQCRKHTPRRWLIKDMAGLYFSAMDCGLSQRDLLRVMARYSQGGLRQALGADAKFWRAVARRAQKLYRRQHGRTPPLPVGGAQ
ncbi:MAG: lipopolysaccharide core heptose(I) kinase RfaP [Pseudomonadota bacterium]